MKIRIEYDFSGSEYRAVTFVDRECFVALSDTSFEEAKEKLLKKVKNFKKIAPPKPEEIEI